MSSDRSLSPVVVSYTSDGDSTRRDFFDSVRVKSSPTPTPLSETPRDFQLICNPSEFVTRPRGDINGCRCGPVCEEPCCVSTRRSAWNTSISYGGPRLDGKTAKKLHVELGGRNTNITRPSSQTPYPEHDRASVGSNDSCASDHLGENRGETPLLPPDEQRGFTTDNAIVSVIIDHAELS